MRRILSMAGLNLQQLIRDRSELIGFIVLPLMLTWVFGLAFGSSGASPSKTVVPVANLDSSIYATSVIAEIDASNTLKTESVTEAEARRRIEAGEAPTAVIIPQGFGAAVETSGSVATIQTLRDPGSSSAQAIVTVVRGAATRIATNAKAARVATQALALGAGGASAAASATAPATPDFRTLYTTADGFWSPDPPVGVTSTFVQASAAHSAEISAPADTQYSMGFTVFFVVMIAIGGAGGILEEREMGTLRRLLGTPTSRAQIILGKVLGVAVLAAAEAAMLVGFGTVVFGVPWGNQPLAVGFLLLSLVLAATGLGVMVSALVRTRSQLSAVAPALSTALAMLGGCYWPIEITPPLMQKVALATPTGWAMVGLKDAVARGLGVGDVLVPAAVLLGMAVLFFVIGLTRLRLE
ncbi:MAG: ABC transporter permease [Coriobacteriia bacterium]|nr:ABC transporter permease [Coriobacteriia bacterium]